MDAITIILQLSILTCLSIGSIVLVILIWLVVSLGKMVRNTTNDPSKERSYERNGKKNHILLFDFYSIIVLKYIINNNVILSSQFLHVMMKMFGC